MIPIPRIPLTEQLIGLELELELSHVIVVGGSRDIDSAVRELSDRLVATEVLPALRSPQRRHPTNSRSGPSCGRQVV